MYIPTDDSDHGYALKNWNPSTSECYAEVPCTEITITTTRRLTSVSSLSITAAPPNPPLSTDQSYWNQTAASLSASKAFNGAGINASLSSYCIASQLAGFNSAYADFMLHSTLLLPQIGTYTLDPRSETATATFPFQFYAVPSYSPPCCGYCTVWAANAKVFYWPTPNPHPSKTTVVDSTGFT